MVKARAFKPLPLCSAPLEILLAVIFGALGIKKATFLSKYVFWENAVGYLRNGKGKSLQIFAIVFSTPENVIVGNSGALGTQESHFVSKNVFWENAAGYLKNSEC